MLLRGRGRYHTLPSPRVRGATPGSHGVSTERTGRYLAYVRRSRSRKAIVTSRDKSRPSACHVVRSSDLGEIDLPPRATGNGKGHETGDPARLFPGVGVTDGASISG